MLSEKGGFKVADGIKVVSWNRDGEIILGHLNRTNLVMSSCKWKKAERSKQEI
jgi:hypothetical protein